MASRLLMLSILWFLVLGGCGDAPTDGDGDSDGDSDSDADSDVETEIDPNCTSVRLTQYAAGPMGWCEFDTTDPLLPSFVQDWMTAAIAEPWNGGSFGGSSGEACGECWEVSTSHATQILMITNLCPVEGNPLCAGGHFHFDLTEQAAAVLHNGGLNEGSARRVPCPVDGNIHASISNWNQWGYMRVAFINHSMPIRTAELRMAPDGPWIPFERSGGAWQVLEGPTFADGGGPGVHFRVTTAEGQTVESTTVIPFVEVPTGGSHHVVDIGIQVEPQHTPGSEDCEFEPEGLVYSDSWGGIDEVRWAPNPWGDTSISETNDGCWDSSASCLRIDGMGSWSGMHLYYRQGFPADEFSTLSLWARTVESTAEIQVAASYDGERCGEQTLNLSTNWSELTLDIAGPCRAMPWLNSVTVQNGGPAVPILFDEIRFE